MKYIYPALFTPDGDGFLVDFPDLPGCYTDGSSMTDAFDNAEDALALYLWDLEKSNTPAPAPSKPAELNPGAGTITLIKADTLPVWKLNDKKSIRKNITIPSWMDAIVQRHNGNFSQLLQNAICREYGIELA